jgi:hypothetical protein
MEVRKGWGGGGQKRFQGLLPQSKIGTDIGGEALLFLVSLFWVYNKHTSN